MNFMFRLGSHYEYANNQKKFKNPKHFWSHAFCTKWHVLHLIIVKITEMVLQSVRDTARQTLRTL